ncbi:MAG: MFS transporter [Acidimicrobiales bacterium]
MPKPPRFHGWKVVGAGAFVQALQSALFNQSFSSYSVIWERQFGWSKTLLSSAYGMTQLQGGLGAVPVGWALDRFENRKVVRFGLVTMAIGFFLMSRITSPVHLFVAVFITAAGLTMSGFLSITTITVRWFERRRARALSLSATGFAIGGGLVPAVVFSIERFGWRNTLAVSAVLLVALSFPLTRSFAGTPAERGELLDGFANEAERQAVPLAEGAGGLDFTLAEAVRTRAFWMLSLGHMSALFVVVSVIAHLSLYLTTEHGYSLQKASFVGGALPAVQLVGMLSGGVLGDKYNKRLLSVLAMIGHTIGLLLLTFATHSWMIWAFVPIHGFSWGVRGPLMQALRADYFGTANFGQIMGVSSIILTIGSFGGPMLAGIIADHTGSYRIGFTIIASFAAAGMVFFMLATPPAEPRR